MVFILYPLTTERAVAGIEGNRLTFIVTPSASKPDVRSEIKQLYGEDVTKVTTSIGPDGRKKATVQFKKKNAASELAGKLKIL